MKEGSHSGLSSLKSLLDINKFKLSQLLIVGFIITFIFLLVSVYLLPLDRTFDEKIVYDVSTYRSTDMLDVIKVEPHPPGFYYLLKVLPNDDMFLLRGSILTIYSALIALVIFYLYKRQALEKYALGLMIFLSSYTMLGISHTLKQDAISVPILMLVTFAALKKDYFIMHLGTFSLLFFGYVNYAFAIFVCTAAILTDRKNINLIRALFLQLAVFITYMAFYGYEQAINNSIRFYVGDPSDNLLTRAYMVFTTGSTKNVFTGDLVIIAAVAIFVLWLLRYLKSKNREFEQTKLLMFFSLSSLASFILQLYIRVRYVSFVFLALNLIIGLYISNKSNLIKLVSAVVVFSILFMNLVTTFYSLAYARTLQGELTDNLNAAAQDENVGFISDGSLETLYYYLNFKDTLSGQVRPVSPIYPHLMDKTRFDKESLFYTRGVADIDINKIKQNFSQFELNSYVYLVDFGGQIIEDEERAVYELLMENCDSTEIIDSFDQYFLMEFNGCRFE